MNRFLCGVAASVMLGACSGPAVWQHSDAANGTHASGAPAVRPIYLRAMKTHLAMPREKIGSLYEGASCMPAGDMAWSDGLFRQISQQLPKIFRRDMQRAHYPVPPESASSLNTTADSDYVEVDMQVQEAHANLCVQDGGISGDVTMQVAWQVYSAGATAPLYETVTQGSYRAPLMERRTSADFFADAFSAALDDLLADRGFQEAVKAHARR